MWAMKRRDRGEINLAVPTSNSITYFWREAFGFAENGGGEIGHETSHRPRQNVVKYRQQQGSMAQIWIQVDEQNPPSAEHLPATLF
jgi:hypothetical protein